MTDTMTGPMTDDPYPANTLPAALRTMAESGLPPAMDVERVLHEGRHSLMRRRMAALGGGTAVVAATALAVGVLAPAGSAGHAGGQAAPAGSSKATPTAALTTLPASVNPHDPIQTHWGFGYLPADMVATGGAGTATSTDSTVWAYAPSGFRLQVEPLTKPPVIDPNGKQGKGTPTEKVPADVPGAVQAYWLGYGHGQIVLQGAGIKADGLATLVWQLRDGQILSITALHTDHRADWKQQTLKAAAHVVRQDRSVPMPIKLAGVPQGFSQMGAMVTRDDDDTFLEYNLAAGKDKDHNNAVVAILAFKTGGQWKPGDGAPPQDKSTCEDSHGLTLCISAPIPEPAPLTAMGGAKALLQRITSLGNDPANWTTDVLP